MDANMLMLSRKKVLPDRLTVATSSTETSKTALPDIFPILKC